MVEIERRRACCRALRYLSLPCIFCLLRARKRFPLRSQMMASKSPRRGELDSKDCLLLSRLPLEVRILIYQEVLGGHMLHIIMRKGWEIGHLRCWGCIFNPMNRPRLFPPTMLLHGRCSTRDEECDPCESKRPAYQAKLKGNAGSLENNNQTKKVDIDVTEAGLLSLLRTCKQVYVIPSLIQNFYITLN